MTCEDAVDELRTPRTWFNGAEAMVRIGGQRAILALLRAYEAPIEASKLCLLNAMDELDAVSWAVKLADSGDAEERRLGIHMMQLFPDPRYLPALEVAADDTDPKIAAQARRSLVAQHRTATWKELMNRLLGSDDAEVREMADACLSGRR